MNIPSIPCQRCGAPYSEQVERIRRDGSLTARVLTHLDTVRYEWLCSDCVTEFDNMAHYMGQEGITPEAPPVLGRDYTVEDGLYVFTAFYHFRRGYCCGSGCRHCAYGIALAADEGDQTT